MRTTISILEHNTCGGAIAEFPVTIIACRGDAAPTAKPLYRWRGTEEGCYRRHRMVLDIPDDAMVLQVVTSDRSNTHLTSSECPISIASIDGDDVALSVPVGWSAYVVSTATLAERAVEMR